MRFSLSGDVGTSVLLALARLPLSNHLPRHLRDKTEARLDQGKDHCFFPNGMAEEN